MRYLYNVLARTPCCSQVKHVISQASSEHYVCLWVGCKVHGRTSCSRSWLERHVLGHAGNKPFRCIVDGCGCRFNSQVSIKHPPSTILPTHSWKKNRENVSETTIINADL